MPTPELMTWIPSQRRWTRMHKGKRYYVSCRQLGCPETKEASVRFANEWWKAKEAELNASRQHGQRTPKPMDDVLAALIGGKQWESVDAIVDSVRCLLDQLPPSAEAETLADQAEYAAYLEVEHNQQDSWEHVAAAIGKLLLPRLLERAVLDGESLPERLREHLPPARLHQLEEGVRAIRGEQAAEPDRTIKANVDRWVATQQALVAAGALAPDHAENRRICLNHFAGFLGEAADVNTIDAARFHDFYLWCLQKVEIRHKDKDRKAGWSADYAKKVFTTARTFVRFLWESGLIELPRNVNSSAFRFNTGAKAIGVWSVDEVRRVIGEAPGQLKLHLLLMLNCGFTQVDVSDLADNEVNWNKGRIIRKRSKTRSVESVPTVEYVLWPITFKLLQQYRSGTERVLLTESGLPFVRKEQMNGKYSKTDNVRSNFAHLQRRLKFTKPMKWLRKTGATLLDRYDPSGATATLYLGHSPRSMKDRHYSRPDQEHFDRAIAWLGQQLGFVESDSPQAVRD